MKAAKRILICSAVFFAIFLASSSAMACSNAAVPGRSTLAASFSPASATGPSSSNFTFKIQADGSFLGRTRLNRSPLGACSTTLYAKLDLTASTGRVVSIATKRSRSRVVYFSATGLPPVQEYKEEIPILNLMTRTTCGRGSSVLLSNVFARYLKCGANGKRRVTPFRYTGLLASSVR